MINNNNANIVIIEKPDNISWDSIHEVLWAAHAPNRAKNIYMTYPSLPGEEIRDRIEGKGQMFLAMDGDKIVGTAAYIVRNSKMWYAKGDYAYLCFACVLPEYSGSGIYKKLFIFREKEARRHGYNTLIFDTSESNKRMLEIQSKNGFRKVRLLKWRDHYSIMMAKWLDGRSVSEWLCIKRYWESKTSLLAKEKGNNRIIWIKLLSLEYHLEACLDFISYVISGQRVKYL